MVVTSSSESGLPTTTTITNTRTKKTALKRKSMSSSSSTKNKKSKKQASYEEDKSLRCPLTGLIMTDPVQVSNSHIFERSEIIKHWHETRTTLCPITGQVLDGTLLERSDLKKKVIEHLKKHPSLIGGSSVGGESNRTADRQVYELTSEMVSEVLFPLVNQRKTRIIHGIVKQNPDLLINLHANGYNLFQYICEFGSEKMVDQILKEADLRKLATSRLPTTGFFKPVHLNTHVITLIRSNQLQVQDVEVYLRLGFDINHVDKTEEDTYKQDTALNWAAEMGNLPLVKTLIQHKADFHSAQTHASFLHAAVLSDNLDIVKYAVEDCHMSVESTRDKDGDTAFAYACHLGKNLHICRYLIEKGALPGSTNNNWVTPLHLAAENAKLAHVKFLISLGEDVDKRDQNGDTPLHAAVRRGKSNVIEFLILAGADISAKDNNGKTPKDVTSKEHIKELITTTSERAMRNVLKSSMRTQLQFEEVKQRTMELEKELSEYRRRIETLENCSHQVTTSINGTSANIYALVTSEAVAEGTTTTTTLEDESQDFDHEGTIGNGFDLDLNC